MASVPKGMDFNDLLDKEDVDLIFTLEEEIAAGSFGTVYKVRLCSLASCPPSSLVPRLAATRPFHVSLPSSHNLLFHFLGPCRAVPPRHGRLICSAGVSQWYCGTAFASLRQALLLCSCVVLLGASLRATQVTCDRYRGDRTCAELPTDLVY